MRKHHRPFEACPNCGTNVTGHHFCSKCGQENHDLHLPAHHIFLETLESVFHFETKFFRTLKVIFTKPGQITRDFIHGKRASQFHPFRLYVFTAFLFFLFLTMVLDKRVEEVKGVDKILASIQEHNWKNDKQFMTLLSKSISTTNAQQLHKAINETDKKLPKMQQNDKSEYLDWIRGKMEIVTEWFKVAYPDKKFDPYAIYIGGNTETRKEQDAGDFEKALTLLKAGKTESKTFSADSLQQLFYQHMQKLPADIMTKLGKTDGIKIVNKNGEAMIIDSVNLGKITLNKAEALKIPKMSHTELNRLLDKNKVSNRGALSAWGLRLNAFHFGYEENPKEFLHTFLKKFSYLILFMMPLLALLLKFFYFQAKRLYYEHLIFAIHFHVMIFLFTGISLLSTLYFYQPTFISLMYFGLILYGFLAFQNFYRSETRKVSFKEWIKTFYSLPIAKKSILILFYLLISPLLFFWLMLFGLVYFGLWIIQKIIRIIYLISMQFKFIQQFKETILLKSIDYFTQNRALWEFSKFSVIIGIYATFIMLFTFIGISLGYFTA